MTDGGGRQPGVSFPMKVHTDDEDFVIELDETQMASPPDEYGLDGDRVRCKRRKRCGQCGPCQVKENCNKCHFCIRKDVLKQTCIYRKCIYLRSKPKPYARPRDGEPVPGVSGSGRSSPQHTASSSMRSPSANMRSPMQSPHMNLRTPPGINMPFKEQAISGSEVHSENPFLPPHLPQAPITSNAFNSQQNHMMDRAQSLPHSHPTAGNMNMHMNMPPHAVTPDMSTSPPVQRMGEGTPPVVNSPPSAIPGLPPPPVPHATNNVNMSPFIPPISNSALPGMPPVSVPSMPVIGDRPTFSDFRHPDQVPITHHPHPHFPPVHPHTSLPMTHRDTNMFAEHSRVPTHMNFNMNATGHVDNLSRGANDSSCMYHPGLPPYSVPGPFHQPSGPAFFGGSPTPDMFRSNFLNSFPPGYSYPTNRYSDGFRSMPFSGLGMGSPSPFPQYPGQGTGMGMSSAFSQQYSPYNSQHGCPKNGSCPPVSPSIDNDDVKVLQAGYKLEKSNSASSVNSAISQPPSQNMSHLSKSMPSAVLSSTYELHDVKAVQEGYRNIERSNSISSLGSRSSFWEPWKSPSLYSPRYDEVRSRLSVSTMSSDFEADIIGVDDFEMNALIRSNGCNSIEIEFDKRSMSEEYSPRKCLSVSDNESPMRNIGFRPINANYKQPRVRELFSPERTVNNDHSSGQTATTSGRHSDNAGIIEIDLDANGKNTEYGSRKRNLGTTSDSRKGIQDVQKQLFPKQTAVKPGKKYFKGSVCLKQDLGDEGTIQLELPGRRVTIEDTILDENMSKSSSNLKELLDFIDGRRKFANLNVQSEEAVSLD